MKEKNEVLEKSFLLGVGVTKLSVEARVPRFAVLVKQILSAGTSVAAHVEEAQGAESKADFIHKMAMAYKEARETSCRLKMLHLSGARLPSTLPDLTSLSGEVVRLLTSILKTCRERNSAS